jgi:signal recognition particle receptor subunit beta
LLVFANKQDIPSALTHLEIKEVYFSSVLRGIEKCPKIESYIDVHSNTGFKSRRDQVTPLEHTVLQCCDRRKFVERDGLGC